MSTILTPLSNGLYTRGKGVANFYPFADPFDPTSYGAGKRLCDMDSLDVQVAITEGERFSNEHSVKTLALKPLDTVTVTVTMVVAQMSNMIRAAAVLGKETVHSQVADPDQARDFSDAGIYWLGCYGPTNIVATKGAGLPAVLGTDYKVDVPSGQIETLVADVSITFDVPAIESGFATGIASGTGLRGMLMYRGVNALGVQALMQLHDVELRPTGARSYISDTEIQTITLAGTAYLVSGQPEGCKRCPDHTLAG